MQQGERIAKARKQATVDANPELPTFAPLSTQMTPEETATSVRFLKTPSA